VLALLIPDGALQILKIGFFPCSQAAISDIVTSKSIATFD
jgi:hypothetical protein